MVSQSERQKLEDDILVEKSPQIRGGGERTDRRERREEIQCRGALHSLGYGHG